MVMGCGCENKRLASELDRARRLAKAYARIEQTTVAIWRNADGTYGFCPVGSEQGKDIVEYVTKN